MSTLPPFQDIADNMDLLDDWEDRYRYVIELGQMLAPLADNEKTAEAKVSGCASQVWLAVDQVDSKADPTLKFRGDSDAMIVKGLVALLVSYYGEKPASEIAALDASIALKSLGLEEHLTSQRANGLASMIKRMRAEAAARSAN